jgi:SpoVK/Ycf46/Vps4 family AAA+-type ATPase
MAPAVLWLDEIDKAFADTGSEAAGRVLGSFLTWLGEQRSGVFVAATANRIEHLPPELLRKGRFDETFFVDLPDLAVRADIFAIHLRKSGRDPNGFDLQKLGLSADRLTGAEIEQAVTEALAIAFAEGRELAEADVHGALAKTVPFVETYEAQVKALRDWARRRCRSAAPDRSLRELYLSASAPVR